MKRILFVLFIILNFTSISYADRIGILVSEPDGDPDRQYALELLMPNGTLTVEGNSVGYSPTSAGPDVTLSADAEAAGLSITDQEIDLKLATTSQSGTASYTNIVKIEANDTDTKIVNRIRDETITWTGEQSFENIHLAAGSVAITAMAALSDFTTLSGDWKTTGYMSGQANVQTDTSGDITATLNAVNYGTDTGDVEIPDGACDDAADVGNWLVVTTSVADTYALVSLDASNQFTVAANADAYTAGYELDIDGTQVCVMCIAAELWKVTGYMGAVPTDGGMAD